VVSKDDLDICVEEIREENRLENLSSGEDENLEAEKNERVVMPFELNQNFKHDSIREVNDSTD